MALQQLFTGNAPILVDDRHIYLITILVNGVSKECMPKGLEEAKLVCSRSTVTKILNYNGREWLEVKSLPVI